MDYIDLFNQVKTHPEMYLYSCSCDEALGFITGCDASSNWSLLKGFREWLIPQLDGFNNLSWHVLVLKLAEKRNSDSAIRVREDETDLSLVFDLVIEFLEITKNPDGILEINKNYSIWLNTKRH